ncbi:hypothetical protein MK489_19150 [Myxococcota bacterium]|nr:hypothetical protein [Myxococcota bacterium]
MSPRLFELKTGDPLLVKARAKGKLTLCPTATEHLMVASVTGIAPFRSMVRHALEDPRAGATPHFTLLHGGANAEELVYAEELTALARAQPDRFTYIPRVSPPGELSEVGCEAATGRVSTAALPFIERLDPTKTQVYACGHPAMIDEVRVAVCRRGFSFASEAFWKL